MNLEQPIIPLTATRQYTSSDLTNAHNKAQSLLRGRPEGEVQVALKSAVRALEVLNDAVGIDEARRNIQRLQRDIKRNEEVLKVYGVAE